MIGETVSHYRILERAGAGGMGVVYKAEDTKLGRTVALKFLPAELTGDADARERLRLEAQAASALEHPNICTIFGIDETPDGRVFVAMSYYEGETLKERIARGALPVPEALRIGVETTRAVAAAHEAGIIHRDIKPANIMLTKRGEVKLLDFGIAKVSGRTAITQTGTTFGTVAYMAPERVVGQAADRQTDAWALGVVLYEMLAGRPPFEGEHDVAVINAIAHTTPTALHDVRAEVPVELERIVSRALDKSRDTRYASAEHMLEDLETLATALRGPITAGTRVVTHDVPSRSRSIRWAAAGLALVGVVGAGGWWAYHAARAREARDRLGQLQTLVADERFSAAFRLMASIQPELAGDPEFENLSEALFLPGRVTTIPEGAEVFIKGYDEPDADWIQLGRSPVDFLGFMAYFRWRVVHPGYAPFEGVGPAGLIPLAVRLLPEDAVPDGTVPVPAGSVDLGGVGAVPVDAFFIDRYEVTNRQFKAFVDAGGYLDRTYWREPFVVDGRVLTWEEGMAELRDATGRPGPSGWELSAYPEGEDDLPVTGVSWYEANAYAVWAGRELPTVHHWRRAAPDGNFSGILEFSNYSNAQISAVGSYPGLGEYGTYDMAGNAREWCWNAVGDQRYILGGAWNQPPYLYQEAAALDPLDRSSINGFRTMARESADPIPDVLLASIDRFYRDYSREAPVSDEEFEIYRRLYAYDPTDLEAVVELTDDSSDAWRVERVSYAAAYGGERIPAYLFLPKHVSPPYQTVVYFPHSGGQMMRSFEQSEMSYLGFIVRAGRALLLPMYKGMYERRLDRPPDGPIAYRDLTVDRIKDLRRSMDYLESRPDIDRERIAFFGVSLGGRLGNQSLAIEQRFRAAVLWSGGFRTALTPNPPEIDEINFAPRVTAPVLMLNGRQDFAFPVETSQVPMFRLLGTPAADKRHVIYEGGHVFPFARIIKDTLEWLDRYLGVPQ